MPLAHVGGLGVVVRSLVQRTPLVLHEGPGDGGSLAAEAGVTHVSMVPTTLARMLDRGEVLPPSVRVVLLGGAACSEALLARAVAAGVPIHPTYGLTETCGQVATATRDPRALAPLPGVALRIENGTIRVRTPSAMDGWLDAESPFDSDGFYDTGDLGELEGGALRIHARRTDLVVSGGENVYPREVEDALERIEGVRAACVFGVPDPEWGQRVAAAIVTDERAPSDGVIRTRLRAELAAFKLPRLVARLDALETNGTGKIDRARTAARSIPLLRAL
jgi:O-succinylbenzoic acid--CoA ligase